MNIKNSRNEGHQLDLYGGSRYFIKVKGYVEMTQSAKNRALEYIHCIIIIAFMFVFRFIPPPSPITAYGMQVIGVFLGVIWGWSFCGLMWPSLLALVAMGLTEFGNETVVWATAFGNSTAVLTLVSMLLFGALQATNTTDWMLKRLLNLKMIQRKPWLLTFFLLMSALLLGSIISGLVVILFVIAILNSLFKNANVNKGDKYAVLMIIGINFFAGIGMVMFPFLGWDLMTIGTVSAATGVNLDYIKFVLVVWPALFVFCIVYVLLMKYVFKCDASIMSTASIGDGDVSLKKNQRYLLYLTIAYLLAATFVGLVSGTTGIAYISGSLGVYGVTLLIIILMVFIKTEEGPLLNVSDCSAYVSWDMYFLIVSALFIANQLTNEKTGISEWTVQFLMPILSDVSSIIFYIIISIVTVIATNIGNNMAMGFTLLSVVSILYNAGLPFNPMIAATLITVLCLFGLLLPASSIGGAIIHASEWCDKKSIYKYVSYMLIVGTVIVVTIVTFLGNLLF